MAIVIFGSLMLVNRKFHQMLLEMVLVARDFFGHNCFS